MNASRVGTSGYIQGRRQTALRQAQRGEYHRTIAAGLIVMALIESNTKPTSRLKRTNTTKTEKIVKHYVAPCRTYDRAARPVQRLPQGFQDREQHQYAEVTLNLRTNCNVSG